MEQMLGQRAEGEGALGEHQSLSVGDISRLMELVSEVSERAQCSPSEAIDSISRIVSPTTSEARRERAVLAAFVSRVQRLRLRRNELIGAPLFRDPAWDMLLELFVAYERGESVPISSLCYASGIPLSTGTRQVQRLEEHGLVTRNGDHEDSRRFIVEPTPKSISCVATIASMLLDEIDAFPPESRRMRPVVLKPVDGPEPASDAPCDTGPQRRRA